MTGGGIMVWDQPVRLVHWALVLLLPLLWWTAEQGEFDWHFALGSLMLALLVFRIAWGFIGSDTARFGSFVRGPRAIVCHLTRRDRAAKPPIIGHNPLGGWSVLAMLLLLLCQVLLGLVAGDPDDHAVGPLNHLVSFTLSDQATELHELLFNAILALMALHIAAVLGYLLVKRENLISPMINGRKVFSSSVWQPDLAPPLRAMWCALVAAGLAGWLYAGAPLP